jgi:DNA invertase Pin-like site-specific DNA recombinase
LLEAARLRQIDLVLALRLDCWGRSVDTLRLLTSYGVAWLAVQQNLGTDESNPMGRFMLNSWRRSPSWSGR